MDTTLMNTTLIYSFDSESDREAAFGMAEEVLQNFPAGTFGLFHPWCATGNRIGLRAGANTALRFHFIFSGRLLSKEIRFTWLKRTEGVSQDVSQGEDSDKRMAASLKMVDALRRLKRAFLDVSELWTDPALYNSMDRMVDASKYPFFTASFDELGIDEFCDDMESAVLDSAMGRR